MNWRNRRVRLAIVLTMAVVVGFLAWRTGEMGPKRPPCTPGRHEEKDAAGKVVRITNTHCFE